MQVCMQVRSRPARPQAAGSSTHQPAVLATLAPPHFSLQVLVLRVEHPRGACSL